MASSEIYFKEVVVVTTIPTNKVDLRDAVLIDIAKKTFLRDTTFYVICGFHTKENGEPAKYDSNLMKQFQEMTLSRGFQSSVAPRLHFGLGQAAKIDDLKTRFESYVNDKITTSKISTDQNIQDLEADLKADTNRKVDGLKTSLN